MAFDAGTFPAASSAPDPAQRDPAWRDRRRVALWLFGLCFMVVVMIGLGGATRLTGSGLSIMEWDPIMGILPPLSDAEWHRLFALYKQIPQYALVNEGFGLQGFKHIFWLEWTHRLWGRLMGIALIVPLVWLAWKGAIRRRLVPRLALLFVLGGLQGAVGWFMVASGFFPDSTAVSPYRLVIHLAFALVLYVALLWTALGEWRTEPVAAAPPGLRRAAWALAGLAGFTILAGGFVAGLHAGLAYNTFPLMDGRLIPAGYAALHRFLRNLTENIPAVQFDHRLLATLTLLAILATAFRHLPRLAPGPAARALFALTLAALAQYALGVTTLLWVVPPALGTLHQVVAVLVLTAAVALLHAARAPSAQESS